MSNVGSVQVGVTLAIDALEAQMRLVTQRLDSLQNVAISVDASQAVQAFDMLAGYAEKIWGGASNFIKSSVMGFVDFDQQIVALGALSGATESQLKGLREETLRLGSATSKSPQQVAEAGKELIKLGFSAQDTQKNLAGLVGLAEATGGAMSTAGSVVGATTSVFEVSATRIADVVAATANATAADMDDFLQVISKAGGVAKANGQSLEILATAFGLIRNTGYTAESAATALKSSITKLAAPTGKAKEGIDKLGISLRDGDGQMRSLLDLIPEFRTALDNVAPEEKAQLVKAIFGDEAGPAFLGLLATSQEKIQQTFDTITNSTGAAGTTSAQLMQGVAGAMEMLQGSIETVSLQIGGTFAPALETLANIGISVLGVFDSLPDGMQQFAIITVATGVAIAGLVTALSVMETMQIGARLATMGLGIEQLKLTAITYAQSVATIAQNVATMASTNILTVNNGVRLIALGVTGAITVATVTNTVATVAYNVALGVMNVLLPTATANMSGFAVASQSTGFAIGSLMAIIGLAIAAFASLKMAFDSVNAGNKEAKAINDLGKELDKISGVTTTADESVKGFKGSLNQAFEGGMADGIFNVFGMLGDKIKGSNDALSEYGGNWGRVNKEQLANQRIILATEGVVEKVHQTYQQGKDIMTKYGVEMLDASDKARLGAEGIKAFTEEAKAQIKINQEQIDALKAKKPANETEANILNAQINILEGANRVLNQRTQALNTATTATDASSSANKELAKTLGDVQSAMEGKLGEMEQTAEEARTEIAEALSGGKITEDEAGKQTATVELNNLKDRLKNKQDYLAELRLLEKTTADPEELAKVQKDIASTEMESQKIRTEIAKLGYDDRKQKMKESLDAEANLTEKTNREIEQKEQAKIMTIKQAQLSGAISVEEAQKRIKDVTLSTIDEEIKAEQDKLQRKRDLLASGAISEKEYEEAEREILGRIGELRNTKLDEQIAKKEDAKKKEKEIRDKANAEELLAIETANKNAERAINQSVNNQILALKNKLLQGVITEEEYQKQVAQIQANATNKDLQNTQRELSQLEYLKNKKLITEQEYITRKTSLEDELATQNQTRIDQQLNAQKIAKEEAIKLIQERADFEISKLNEVNFAEEQRLNALKSEGDLLNASLGLQQAQASLAEQRLQFAIENANTEQEKFSLEQQLQDLKEANLLKTQEAELKILDIKQQQAMIEAQRQKTLADIAVLEAEAAIAQAEARGASEGELAKLRQILGMKQQIAQASAGAITQQENLNKLEKDTVLVKQQAEREAMTQQGIKLDKAQLDAQKAKLEEQLKATGGESSSTSPTSTTPKPSSSVQTTSSNSEPVSEQLKAQGLTSSEFTRPAQNESSVRQVEDNVDVAIAGEKIDKIAMTTNNSVDEDKFNKEILEATIKELQTGNDAFLEALDERGLGNIGELATKLQDTSVFDRSSAINQGNIQGMSLEESLTKLTEKLDGLNGNLQRPNINVSTATPLEDTLQIMSKPKR